MYSQIDRTCIDNYTGYHWPFWNEATQLDRTSLAFLERGDIFYGIRNNGVRGR